MRLRKSCFMLWTHWRNQSNTLTQDEKLSWLRCEPSWSLGYLRRLKSIVVLVVMLGWSDNHLKVFQSMSFSDVVEAIKALCVEKSKKFNCYCSSIYGKNVGRNIWELQKQRKQRNKRWFKILLQHHWTQETDRRVIVEVSFSSSFRRFQKKH